MMFRRIKAHIEKENWFAVCIDFGIVVFGVFIGFQVQAWNEQRQEKAQEKIYLERLHEDVQRSLEETSTTYAFQTLVRTNLNKGIQAFGTGSKVTELPTDQCLAIYFSHIYDDTFLPQAAVTELLASGQFSILEDSELRTRLVSHARALEGWREGVDGIQVDRVVLPSRYPTLIELEVELSKFSYAEAAYLNNDIDGLATCDLKAMRLSPGFKNDFIDNSSRHEAYFSFLSQQQYHLGLIHESLDEILDIGHGEGETP